MNSRMSLKSLLTFTLALLMVVGCVAGLTSIEASAATEAVATFELGANGSASHNDGTSKSTYSETVNGYTLSVTNGTKFYTGARDAKGNSCFKLGTSSAVGSFQFTVPSDVTEVHIFAAKYKTNTTKVSVNGNSAVALTKASNNGEYDEIVVDTSSNKTVTFASATGGVRCMVNTIVFYAAGCSHTDTYLDGQKDATCTENGYTGDLKCSDCDELVEAGEEIDAFHPDADENGQCDVCGECSHQSTSPVEDVPPTCTEPGWAGKTICDACGEVANPGEEVPKTGHLETEDNLTQEPTCTEPGKKDKVCVECGEVVQSNLSVPATGHTLDENNQCTVCGETILEASLSFADDANRTASSTTAQVWEQNGITVNYEKNTYNNNLAEYANPFRVYAGTKLTVSCGGIMISEIVFNCNNASYASALQSSISDAGATVSINGSVVTVTFTSPVESFSVVPGAQVRLNSLDVKMEASGEEIHEHVWPEEWIVDVEATKLADGSQHRQCKECEETQTQSIPAIADVELTIPEANQVGSSKPSNAYTAGKYYVTGVIVEIVNTTYGNVYIEDAEGNRFYVYGLYSEDGSVRYDAMEVQPAVGDTITVYGQIGSFNSTPQMKNGCVVAHTIPVAPVMPEASITETVLNLGADLSMKYMVDANESAVEAGMTLEVTFNGETVVLEATQVSEGKYMFVFSGIAPQQMNKNIAVVFKVGGVEVQTKDEDSVKAYLLDMVDDETYGELATAVLAYGDAALKYVNSDEELSGVEVEMYAPLESDKAQISNNELPNHGIVSATVEFDSTVKLVFTVYLGTTEGVDVKLNGVVCEVTAVEGKAGYYTVSTEGLTADRLNEQFTLTIEGAGEVTPTLVYSVNSYAYSMVGHPVERMADLAAALYHYSKCVENL